MNYTSLSEIGVHCAKELWIEFLTAMEEGHVMIVIFVQAEPKCNHLGYIEHPSACSAKRKTTPHVQPLTSTQSSHPPYPWGKDQPVTTKSAKP